MQPGKAGMKNRSFAEYFKMNLHVAVILLLPLAWAPCLVQDTTVNVTEIVTPPLLPSPDVSSVIIFPSSSEKRFQIGDPVELLIGLWNTGKLPVNVTTISAALLHPQDWRVSVQNFTKQSPGYVLEPGLQTSFLYTFFPDPMLEPRDFGFTARVNYHNVMGDGNFSSVLFNDTIFLAEVSEPLDVQALFTYVGVIGVLGLIGFVVFRSLGSVQRKSRKPTARVEQGTKESIDSEWLAGTAADVKHRTPKSPQTKQKAKK